MLVLLLLLASSHLMSGHNTSGTAGARNSLLAPPCSSTGRINMRLPPPHPHTHSKRLRCRTFPDLKDKPAFWKRKHSIQKVSVQGGKVWWPPALACAPCPPPQQCHSCACT